MVFTAARSLKIGTIIDKTLGVVERNAVPSLLYLVALAAINVGISWFTVDMTAISQQLALGLLKALIGIVAAYWLINVMVRQTGLRTRGDKEMFYPYVGLSLLYTLGVGLGFLVIILPGLIVMARWSIAQPMMIARGEGVMRSLGESWERTRGNEFQILVAAFALIIPLIIVLIIGAVMLDQTELPGMIVSQLAGNAMSVVSLATGVALYGLIVGAPTKTFE